jgi:hypothetical protein
MQLPYPQGLRAAPGEQDATSHAAVPQQHIRGDQVSIRKARRSLVRMAQLARDPRGEVPISHSRATAAPCTHFGDQRRLVPVKHAALEEIVVVQFLHTVMLVLIDLVVYVLQPGHQNVKLSAPGRLVSKDICATTQ